MEKTLSLVKPDAVKNRDIGNILSRFERGGLRIVAMKTIWLSRKEAEQFYGIHSQKPFFTDLVDFITSGPLVAFVLEGENAIEKAREIIGATDPKKAAPGTIRADFARSIDMNAVHGSDAPETAKEEVSFFFGRHQLFSEERGIFNDRAEFST